MDTTVLIAVAVTAIVVVLGLILWDISGSKIYWSPLGGAGVLSGGAVAGLLFLDDGNWQFPAFMAVLAVVFFVIGMVKDKLWAHATAFIAGVFGSLLPIVADWEAHIDTEVPIGLLILVSLAAGSLVFVVSRRRSSDTT